MTRADLDVICDRLAQKFVVFQDQQKCDRIELVLLLKFSFLNRTNTRRIFSKSFAVDTAYTSRLGLNFAVGKTRTRTKFDFDTIIVLR